MAEDIKKKIGLQRKRSYLARDFQDFRADLLDHARSHFSDKIQDFSEASLGGLFLDMAAYVGDNMSFYLDHQFRELSPSTVTESKNIESMIKNAGLKITGNAPASVMVNFYIKISKTVDPITNRPIPNPIDIPVILENTQVLARNGTTFYLTRDLDFSEKDGNGKYTATVNAITDQSGNVESYVFIKPGLCISGTVTTETFELGTYLPFRTITLANNHVTSILRVYDSDGNEYHEVESLSQDTVFRKNKLSNGSSSIDIIPAPYRFISSVDIPTRSTTIQFGSGDVSDLETLTDPSQMALPLYGKSTFSQFSLDPNRLMKNSSLGISPQNVTLTVVYRYGGGASHNVEPESIDEVSVISWRFPAGVPYNNAQIVKNSVSVENTESASGGSAGPTLTELKQYVTSSRTMQNRVVTKEDLLARIYTMPTDFGIVYRANVLPNPANALASLLYIVSRDSEGKLTQSSDALKRNLSTYLNEFRLIGDAMDILDAKIINFRIRIEVKIHESENKFSVQSKIINSVAALFPANEINLGKPINVTQINSAISAVTGVISINKVTITNIFGEDDIYDYSEEKKNMSLAFDAGEYLAEPYEIFELRYPKTDIQVIVL